MCDWASGLESNVRSHIAATLGYILKSHQPKPIVQDLVTVGSEENWEVSEDTVMPSSQASL